MTKKEIVQQIAAELKIDQTVVKRVVQRCLDSIIGKLVLFCKPILSKRDPIAGWPKARTAGRHPWGRPLPKRNLSCLS